MQNIPPWYSSGLSIPSYTRDASLQHRPDLLKGKTGHWVYEASHSRWTDGQIPRQFHLSVNLSSVLLSVHPPIHPSIHPSIYLPICPWAPHRKVLKTLTVRLSVCMSVCLTSVCLVCLTSAFWCLWSSDRCLQTVYKFTQGLLCFQYINIPPGKLKLPKHYPSNDHL